MLAFYNPDHATIRSALGPLPSREVKDLLDKLGIHEPSPKPDRGEVLDEFSKALVKAAATKAEGLDDMAKAVIVGDLARALSGVQMTARPSKAQEAASLALVAISVAGFLFARRKEKAKRA